MHKLPGERIAGDLRRAAGRALLTTWFCPLNTIGEQSRPMVVAAGVPITMVSGGIGSVRVDGMLAPLSGSVVGAYAVLLSVMSTSPGVWTQNW
jgi:hypothetical protein